MKLIHEVNKDMAAFENLAKDGIHGTNYHQRIIGSNKMRREKNAAMKEHQKPEWGG